MSCVGGQLDTLYDSFDNCVTDGPTDRRPRVKCMQLKYKEAEEIMLMPC